MSRLRGVARALLRQARAAGAPVLVVDDGPRLWVGCLYPGRWAWELSAPDGTLDGGQSDSWDEALAVGLAALEVASVSERS